MAISRLSSFLCFLFIAFFIPPAAAQTVLEPIVIESGGLAPTDAEKTGTAYTIITGEELEQRQIRHAAEALRTVPGLAVSQAGGSGGLTQIRIRGAESNQVAVFIDGVEANSPDAGEFDFSALLAEDIERIEALRGPQSGVYGGNALSGVINIITKKGGGPVRAAAQAEVGSFGTRALSANASGGSEKGYFSASAVSRETDGFNFARDGKEDDGAEQKAFFVRSGLNLSDDFRIDAMARYQSNNTDIDEDADFDGVLDDVPGLFSEREQKLARISATLDLLDKSWTQKVFADYLGDELNASSGGGPSLNESERTHYGYQAHFKWETPSFLTAKHGLTGLIERREESFETNSSPGALYSREQTGFVGEYRGAFFDQIYLTGNLRRDLNDAFADATTYRATAAYSFRKTGARFHASYGKGITNPTFFEQFGVFGGFVGNPDLQPEESIGWDAGVEQSFANGRIILDVTYFSADLKNEIVTVFNPVFTTINAEGKSKRQGVEVQLTLKPVDGLAITGSYAYTDATQPVSAVDQNVKGEFEELRRPKRSASLNIAYAFPNGQGQVSLGASYNGEMKDAFFGMPSAYVTLDDYLLVNFAASYNVDERLTLFGRVENLLDEDYEEVFSYSSAPVAAYAGVKFSFAAEAPLEPAK